MSDILAMKTSEEGSTALIRLLGSDCTPLQFIREFTQNSIEAIQRTGKSGTLLIDVNWEMMDEFDPVKGVPKISFTDTGDGMTGDEIIQYINHLASSGGGNEYQNYGVGAKIAAITRNEYGIMYESWKDGTGYQAWFYFDVDKELYGLANMQLPDGTYSPYIVLEDDQMPKLIRDHGGHGTRVTLMGMTADQDTMLVPEGSRFGIKESWILRTINSRYFTIPDGVKIKVRIGYDRPRENTKHNHLLLAYGQKATCEKHKVESGTVELSDAKVHWYILKDGRDGHGRENTTGHTAVLNQGEMFHYTDGRSNRASDFGIIIGAANVTLYVEPDETYKQNTQRGGIVDKHGNDLPWERWADEFRELMPAPLKKYIEALMSKASKDSHTDSIRDRLKDLIGMYRLSRYKKSKTGTVEIDPETLTKHNTGHRVSGGGGGGGGGGGSAPGKHAQLLTAYAKAGGVSGEKAKPDPFPRVNWISVHDGTRSPGELEDRAARFMEKDNIIEANSDFLGLQDVVNHFLDEWKHVPEAAELIRDLVRDQYELLLTEVVAGAISFKGRQNWDHDQYTQAISQESLTTAVMSRYYPMREINRKLRSQLGKPKPADAA